MCNKCNVHALMFKILGSYFFLQINDILRLLLCNWDFYSARMHYIDQKLSIPKICCSFELSIL